MASAKEEGKVGDIRGGSPRDYMMKADAATSMGVGSPTRGLLGASTPWLWARVDGRSGPSRMSCWGVRLLQSQGSIDVSFDPQQWPDKRLMASTESSRMRC